MATKTEIKVPDIGDFEKVPVIEVLVAEGDVIEEEQSLVTLESDKATMEVPASKGGKLVELRVSEGDEVSEGDVIGIVEVEDEADSGDDADDSDGKDRDREAKSEAGGRKSEDGSEASDEDESVGDTPETGNRKPETEKSEEDEKPGRSAEQSEAGKSDDLPAPPVPFVEMGRDPSSIPHASPAVRKLARELGVDLSQVEGSAEHGRITEEDLKKHVKSRMADGASAAGGAGGMEVAAPPKVDFAKFGEIEEQKLSRIQKISGPALHRNWVTIPHVTQFDTADITEMEAFRKAAKPEAEEAGTKMTPLVFMIKAVVAGLKKFPKFNTSLSNDGESLVYKKYFHVGVAVDTPNGLMVPVIRDADSKSLLELAHDLSELSGKARDGKLSREEMQGGCMSISSLGGIGGTAFTPIINAPEVAILGVSKAETKPVWNGEEFQPRLMLPLSLSYDHRVIDGADAARFTQYLCHVLGDVRRLML
ncbi:MAG: dihydrolipoyllysine-residue acetyltransferase [Wenzhouxiangellaceae bacterium]|nr:dihydrolipoyllysine-residue acetyltransferase [Wenzhouxiangellaceae bacterium]